MASHPSSKVRADATTQSEAAIAHEIEVPNSINLNDPALYVNRELSLLAFQRRVLEEAEDERNPLLERVKFLAILGSNLDEFFMVRVAGLVAQMDAGTVETGPDALSPEKQLSAIRREVKSLLDEAHGCLANQLLPALEKHGIRFLNQGDLREDQAETVSRYFAETIFPVLTPLAFDPGRPFPHISNLSLNLAILIQDQHGEERFARVKVPDSLPPAIATDPGARLRTKRGKNQSTEFMWIENLIAANLSKLFPGMNILEVHPFHVTRDADIAIKELEAEDLLETIEEGVRQRRFGDVVRLNVDYEMPPHILDILISNLEIDASDVYRVPGPLSLKRLMFLSSLDFPELKEAPFVPSVPKALAQVPDEEDLYSVIRRSDVMFHHPFESFQPVVDFLRAAANDPNVLAIKTVLYRVGRNAPVVEALLDAVENGKQVAVLVELKARFDEESNIEWARALEKVGAHVVYGLVGLKCHCKVAMVVRHEDEGTTMRRYLHLSSGNYNAFTAHLYTDVGTLTADPALADDVTDLFNFLTGYSTKKDYRELLVSPVNLRERFEGMIDREIEHQKRGHGGHLIFKMNALTDPPMIRALYRASQAGVKVDLLVRGSCSLRPGIPGVSDNITVTSIVGRFLEHSRIFYFRNGGKEQIYCGSADLAPRNLNRRVEVLYPIKNPRLIKRLRDEILAVYQSDNTKARRMHWDGTYVRVEAGEPRVNAQEAFLRRSR